MNAHDKSIKLLTRYLVDRKPNHKRVVLWLPEGSTIHARPQIQKGRTERTILNLLHLNRSKSAENVSKDAFDRFLASARELGCRVTIESDPHYPNSKHKILTIFSPTYIAPKARDAIPS